MNWKDTKIGGNAYIFDKKAVTVKVGKITNNPTPHYDSKVATGKMVVDIAITVDGVTTTYVFDDVCDVGYCNDLVLSPNKDAIIREVERVKTQNGEYVRLVDYYKESLAKCDSLMMDLSPEFRQRTESAERMDALEGKVDKIANALSSLLNKIERSNK